MTPERLERARRGALFVLVWCALSPAGLVYGWGWSALAYVLVAGVALLSGILWIDRNEPIPPRHNR